MKSLEVQNGKIIKSFDNYLIEIRPFEITIKNEKTGNELTFRLTDMFNELPSELRSLLVMLINEVQTFYETVTENYMTAMSLIKALKSSG